MELNEVEAEKLRREGALRLAHKNLVNAKVVDDWTSDDIELHRQYALLTLLHPRDTDNLSNSFRVIRSSKKTALMVYLFYSITNHNSKPLDRNGVKKIICDVYNREIPEESVSRIITKLTKSGIITKKQISNILKRKVFTVPDDSYMKGRIWTVVCEKLGIDPDKEQVLDWKAMYSKLGFEENIYDKPTVQTEDIQ
jgi:hypothetical protein